MASKEEWKLESAFETALDLLSTAGVMLEHEEGGATVITIPETEIRLDERRNWAFLVALRRRLESDKRETRLSHFLRLVGDVGAVA